MDFLKPQNSVLPEKGIFTDFNQMFLYKFIVVLDNEYKPPRQCDIFKKNVSHTY